MTKPKDISLGISNEKENQMITKAQFDSLFDDNITKKEYGEIIGQIDQRFEQICRTFLKIGKCGWFGYENGVFDQVISKDYIEIEGGYINPPAGYDLAFPTRWLWEDFEKEMKETSQKFLEQEEKKKLKARERREARKAKLESLKVSITSKLTPEELKAIKFKV